MSPEEFERLLSPEILQAGDVFAGRYKVLSFAGAGSISRVYRAADLSAKSIVALKIIPLAAAGADQWKTLRNTLEAVSRLDHRNVIAIRASGDHEGCGYVSMEYIQGRTLESLMAGRRHFSFLDFLPVFRQFTDALGALHAAGALHGNIKPANVMIDREGVLKLMDPGLAREAAAQGLISGMPDYVAPEVINGQTLTPASDLYSAGVLFFELLAGVKPFANLSLAERLTARPPRLDPKALDIPPSYVEALARCLEPRPMRRYRHVGQLVDTVEKPRQAPSGTPSLIRQTLSSLPVAALSKPAKPIRKLLLAVLLAASVIAATWWLYGRGNRAPAVTKKGAPPAPLVAPASAEHGNVRTRVATPPK